MSNPGEIEHAGGVVTHSIALGETLLLPVPPARFCNLNCLFCPDEGVASRSHKRRRAVEPDTVMADVRRELKSHQHVSSVLIGGGGEPTLLTVLPELLRRVVFETGLPAVVRTNGALLRRTTIRNGLLVASALWIKLSAGEAKTFNRMCRPRSSHVFPGLRTGLLHLRSEYVNRMIIETTFIRGMNDSEYAVRAVYALVEALAPELVILEFLNWEPSASAAYQWITDTFDAGTWKTIVVNRLVPMPSRAAADPGACPPSHVSSWEVGRHLKRIARKP